MELLSYGVWLVWLASSGPPKWVWAALIMAAFVALSVLTMALTRLPVRRRPPPLAGPAEEDDRPA